MSDHPDCPRCKGVTTHPEDIVFLRQWSGAVGTPGYDKRDWQRRQRELYARIYPRPLTLV